MKFCIINESTDLSKLEKNLLIEWYRIYFSKLDGADELDSFLKVIETTSNEIDDKIIVVNNTNYKKAKILVDNLFNNPNENLLLIYENNKIIGAGRIITENSEIVRTMEILFETNIPYKRDIWIKAIEFIENYYKAKDFKKTYLEIPFYEGPLLYRAKDMGYIEDEVDIDISKYSKTYILNKNLEGKKNVK